MTKTKNLIQKFRSVVKKSRAGVKYTHYVPFLEGTFDRQPNRKQRRIVAKYLKGEELLNKKVKTEKQLDIGKKLKREAIAKRHPQRAYLCKQRGCELRNRKGGFCNNHQDLKVK